LLDLKEQFSVHIFDKDKMDQVSWTQDGNIILYNASDNNGLLYDLQRHIFTVVTSIPGA
jgi:hypothetical protein